MPDVELFGESFRIVDDPADMEFAFLEFAETASSTDAESMAGAAAVMHLLEAAIDPEDWQRFKKCCRKNKARTERDLMPIVVKAAEARAERPTQLSSDSSDGRSTTEVCSTAASSSPATLPADPYDRKVAEFNAAGRGDLALLVYDAKAHLSA